MLFLIVGIKMVAGVCVSFTSGQPAECPNKPPITFTLDKALALKSLEEGSDVYEIKGNEIHQLSREISYHVERKKVEPEAPPKKQALNIEAQRQNTAITYNGDGTATITTAK